MKWESKPLPPGEVGGNLPVRAQSGGDRSGLLGGNADFELRVHCPHPLDTSRLLPEGEVGIQTSPEGRGAYIPCCFSAATP